MGEMHKHNEITFVASVLNSCCNKSAFEVAPNSAKCVLKSSVNLEQESFGMIASVGRCFLMFRQEENIVATACIIISSFISFLYVFDNFKTLLKDVFFGASIARCASMLNRIDWERAPSGASAAGVE